MAATLNGSVFRTLIESPKNAEAAADLSCIVCRSTSEWDTKTVSSARIEGPERAVRYGACCYVNAFGSVTI